jgi:hypothetical protein
MGTLYTPPRKRLFPRGTLKVLLILMVVAGLGGYLYLKKPAWLSRPDTLFPGCGQLTITVDVATSPTRADVLLDGERMTELPLQLPRDEAIHHVIAVAPGYEPTDVSFKADGDKNLFLTLRPTKHK